MLGGLPRRQRAGADSADSADRPCAVAIAVVCAIRDKYILTCIFALCSTTMFCGLATELYSRPARKDGADGVDPARAPLRSAARRCALRPGRAS